VRYAVTGRLVVRALSTMHDTATTFDVLVGDVDADEAALDAATGTFQVDMASFDAGDWLRNRKLRKDFAMDDHPRATFQLDRVSNVVREGDDFVATAEGVLRWRGKEVRLVLDGRGSFDGDAFAATGRFDLDIRTLGLRAPSFLMIKMSDEVAGVVTIRGVAR
jgi:polyisoprenoid-binding protein YceI